MEKRYMFLYDFDPDREARTAQAFIDQDFIVFQTKPVLVFNLGPFHFDITRRTRYVSGREDNNGN